MTAAVMPPRAHIERGSKPWIEKQLGSIVHMAMYGAPERTDWKTGTKYPSLDRNLSVALAALMHLARLKGYVVEKKQTLAGKVDLSKLGSSDLRAVLTGHLAELDPDSRRQIELIAAGESEVLEVQADDE